MSDFATTLQQLWPHAKANVVPAIIEVHEACFNEYDMNEPVVVCHFMAQLSQECGQGRIIRESMNYSADRLLEIFGEGKHSAAIKPAEAIKLAHNERAIAERVYGLGNPKKAKELGNVQVGDGYKYRGNGMLQLTGRASHKKIGEETGYDLENKPELLQDPKVSFHVACAEFKNLGAIEWALKDDVRMVTKKVNGGKNGLAERTVFLKQWKEHLDDIEAPVEMPREAEEKEPSMLGSKIVQAAGGTGVAVVVQTVSQLSQTVSQTTEQIQTTADNVKQVVVSVKPFLGLDPEVWHIIAIVASFLAMFGIAKVVWERYKKMRDQGV